MITTFEAAKRLGVSQRRVVDLVHQGVLQAEKQGGIWLVDERSVALRSQSGANRPGRPARGYGKHEQRFTLMNRTHEVAELAYNVAHREFIHISELNDASRAPIGLVHKGAMSLRDFNIWWRDRGIPQARDNLVQVLKGANADVPEELLYRNLGLSLSDQYWIRPEGSGLSWEEINFFNNGFKKAAEECAAERGAALSESIHPDNTSDGNLQKHWIERGKNRILQKGARHFGQEPFNEVVATALHKRLLKRADFVPYSMAISDDGIVSECPNFLADTEEYVPAVYVEKALERSPSMNDYQHYTLCCEHLGASDIERTLACMIVCDDIIANHDRHYRNFGLIRDVETLACRPAPLFDSGSSLWCNKSLKELEKGDFSFQSKPFEDSPARQLLFVEDFSWFDRGAMDGFDEEAISILEQDGWIAYRLPFVHLALKRRVDRMVDIVEWA